MVGRRMYVSFVETEKELGRYLIIKGRRPDWFMAHADRNPADIHRETTLELIQVKYLKKVKEYSSGQHKTTFVTVPMEDHGSHQLVVPAGSRLKVLPDYSFFISDVLIRRAGMLRHLPGQATFYPAVPEKAVVSHQRRERLEFSIAILTYSGSRL